MLTFAPRVEGVVPIRSSAAQFIPAFSQRVAAGLLFGRTQSRSNYQVVEEGANFLRVRAADYWTAINVGLNDLELRIPASGPLQFRVQYWRWTSYAIGLSSVLGLIGVVLLLALDVRSYLARGTMTTLPGLSIDQNLAVVWVMVVFWGFLWPWLLVVLHKRPLRRLVERLVQEVDAETTAR
jgi:hypothetical protein